MGNERSDSMKTKSEENDTIAECAKFVISTIILVLRILKQELWCGGVRTFFGRTHARL